MWKAQGKDTNPQNALDSMLEPALDLEQVWFPFIPWNTIFSYGMVEECGHRKPQCISGGGVVVVQLLSGVQLFVTPWTAPHQTSLSFTIS